MSSRRIALSVAAVGAALAVAGCGGGSSGSAATSAATTTAAVAPAGATSSLALVADAGGKLAFDKSTLTAKAGKVTIALKNPAPLSHNIAIDGVSAQGDVIGQGGTSKVTADLKPGTYTYFCAVPGHRQAGMEGTLTVN